MNMGSVLVVAGLVPSRRLIEYKWVWGRNDVEPSGVLVIDGKQGRPAGTYGI